MAFRTSPPPSGLVQVSTSTDEGEYEAPSCVSHRTSMSPSFSMTACSADMSSLIFFMPLLWKRKVNKSAMILFENAFGENGRKFQGDMPTDVYGLLKTFIDLVGGRQNADRAFLVLSDDAGQYLQFMSGEPAADGFVYTVGRAGDISPSPLPVHIGGTLQDLARAKKDPKGLPFRFTDGDSDYSIKEMQWTEEDAGDGGKVYPIFVELEKAGKAKSGGSAYSGQVETATAFAKAVETLQARTGRDILKEPCVARDEESGDLFTVQPRGGGGERSTLLTLQKAFEGMKIDDPEIRTFGEILEFVKSRPPQSKLFLLASKNRTFGIQDIEFEAGRKPEVLLVKWTDLKESKALRRRLKAEAERSLMAEWKSYCDDEMLYW